MIETFKTRLKAKYSGVNLSQKRIDAYAERLDKKFPDLTEEADHDEKIEDYYDEEMIKAVAKEDERASAPAPEPKQPADPKQPPQPKSEIDELKELVKGLATTVQGITQEKAAQSRAEKLKVKFKEKNVPEKFWIKMTKPEKEEDFDAWVDEVTKDYSEMVPNNDFAPGRSQGPRNTGKANEKEINNLVDGLMNVQPAAQN